MVKYLLCHNKEQAPRLFFLNVNTVEGKKYTLQGLFCQF